MGSEELAAAPTLCCESHSAFAAGALRPPPPPVLEFTSGHLTRPHRGSHPQSRPIWGEALYLFVFFSFDCLLGEGHTVETQKCWPAESGREEKPPAPALTAAGPRGGQDGASDCGQHGARRPIPFPRTAVLFLL